MDKYLNVPFFIVCLVLVLVGSLFASSQFQGCNKPEQTMSKRDSLDQKKADSLQNKVIKKLDDFEERLNSQETNNETGIQQNKTAYKKKVQESENQTPDIRLQDIKARIKKETKK